MNVEGAVQQLSKFLGAEKAERLVQGCKQKTGVQNPATPDELIALADCIAEHGGMIEVVGRALRLQALRQGAKV